MNEQTVGKRIASLRSEKGLTQAALAAELGVTDRAVSKWETGGSYPDVVLLPVIADLLGVTIDYLLRGTPRVCQELYIDYANIRYNQHINETYLANGWIIKDMRLAGMADCCQCAVVLEKTIYD